MKAVINGKIILKDRIVEGSALLYSDVIEGIVPVDKIPQDATVIPEEPLTCYTPNRSYLAS